MLTTTQTLGYRGQPTGRCEYLTMAFSPLNTPLRSRWRNNGLSADFLGDYVITFLPADAVNPATERLQNEIKHAVTYIANELLENAMKYHDHEVNIPIGILLELAADRVTVSSTNGIGVIQFERYQAFVEHMLEQDPAGLLVKQLEENAIGSVSNKSCLGLLTMITDYGAQLGWKFEAHPAYPEIMTVTTSAVLPLSSLRGESQ
jgi:hypothetical protein